MLGKNVIGMALVAGILPLTALAQEDPAMAEELDNGIIVEESQPDTRGQALESLDTASEQTPEAASFGLETAQEAVSQGGVDGQAISDTASEGRSSETAGGSRGEAGTPGTESSGGLGGGSSAGGGAGGSGGGAGGGAGGGRG